MTARSIGKFTLTPATPSTFPSTRSTDATHAPQVMPEMVSEMEGFSISFTVSCAAFHQLPLAVVQGDASTPTCAHPPNTVPSFPAFGTRVQSLHLASAIACLSNNSSHAAATNVVNINPAF